jgi:hypothetical protein
MICGMSNHEQDQKILNFIAVAFAVGGGSCMLICFGVIAYLIHNYLTS